MKRLSKLILKSNAPTVYDKVSNRKVSSVVNFKSVSICFNNHCFTVYIPDEGILKVLLRIWVKGRDIINFTFKVKGLFWILLYISGYGYYEFYSTSGWKVGILWILLYTKGGRVIMNFILHPRCRRVKL